MFHYAFLSMLRQAQHDKKATTLNNSESGSNRCRTFFYLALKPYNKMFSLFNLVNCQPELAEGELKKYLLYSDTDFVVSISFK